MISMLSKHLVGLFPENLHKKRLAQILQTASNLLSHAKLSLTSLGRHTDGTAHVKNKIKAVDRLLGNKHLQAERVSIYQAMAKKVIGSLHQVDVLIDWSKIDNTATYILRASIAFANRSITLYEEIHPEKLLANYTIHKCFLNTLKQHIIPAHVRVVIITDSGFRTDWFQLVLDCNWHFVGRASANMHYSIDNKISWFEITNLFQFKSETPTYIGKVILMRSKQLSCHMYTYFKLSAVKNLAKKSIKKNRCQRSNNVVRKCRN